MAYATGLTISTGNKVSIAYQSQEVNVSLTFQLEREDTDLLQVVREKATEVAQAHQEAWQRIRDTKVEGVEVAAASPPASTEENVNNTEEADEAATIGQLTALRSLLSHFGWSQEQVRDYLLAHCSGACIEQLTQRQASQWLLELQRSERDKAQQRRQHTSHLNGTSHQP